ncbi:RHTO0S12e03378g1_1 [Rhodotorula toruloides]|uniref:RHTO0S12e03378g1_1 n=1 Tax=Rhodotorula toruloides TaxID=5286 RepID=A0A061B8U5_RHOTO|nr:RHTO0S12e03378g1_1 [Rhodotorula toruloides]
MALPLLDPLTAPTVARTRLDALLQRHSLSLSSLLPILTTSGAVLGGGSIPSVVYDPKSWAPRDIDIVVPQAGADAVRKYLGENGFKVSFVPPQGFESSWKRDGETFVVPYALETWDKERKTIDLTIVGGGMSALSHIACYVNSHRPTLCPQTSKLTYPSVRSPSTPPSSSAGSTATPSTSPSPSPPCAAKT